MKTIIVNEDYQKGYSYALSAKTGQDFNTGFTPDLSPKQMLELGIFGGNYFTYPPKEFPSSWFKNARLSVSGPSKDLNYFNVLASQPLSVWLKKGWIYPEDPKGWFLWYCRYYLGRRIPDEDKRQIQRWKNMNRHVQQIKMHCKPEDLNCRPRQRQALLHWAYDSRKL